MEDSPVYRKGNIVEVKGYLDNPFFLKDISTTKFLVDEVEDIKTELGISYSLARLLKREKKLFNEMDFHEELQRIGKEGLMKYHYNRFNSSHAYFSGGSGYIGTIRKEKVEAWENFDKRGIYGSIGREFTYFSTDAEIALNHVCFKPFEKAELIEIDAGRLSKKRNIFPDPEALAFSRERGKTFIVMGGVPKESIKRIYRVKKIQ